MLGSVVIAAVCVIALMASKDEKNADL